MKTCKCGSYALNIAPKSGLCDVCYWKNKHEALKQCHAELIDELGCLMGYRQLTDRDRMRLRKIIEQAKELQNITTSCNKCSK